MTIEHQDMALVQFIPGVQIPLSPCVDFNFGIGYTHYLTLGGGNGSGAVTFTAGFGFHKATWQRTKRRIKREPTPIRNRGFMMQLEAQTISPWNVGYKKGLMTACPTLVLGYRWNENISFGLGYGGGIFRYTQFYEEEILTGEKNYAVFGALHKIYLRGEYRLNDNKISPIASIDLGWRLYRSGEKDEWKEAVHNNAEYEENDAPKE